MVVGAISFGDTVNLLSTAEERLGREVNAVVYPITEFKQKVRDDHHFVKTVLEGEKIFLIGDEGELKRLSGKWANMKTSANNYAFIDSQNLNLSIRAQGWVLDFSKCRLYLSRKYGIAKAFIFIGYVWENQALYTNLQKKRLYFSIQTNS